jgi:hypothetical protein
MTTRKTIAAAALFALNMAIACTITYSIITHVLAPFVDKSDDLRRRPIGRHDRHR